MYNVILLLHVIYILYFVGLRAWSCFAIIQGEGWGYCEKLNVAILAYWENNLQLYFLNITFTTISKITSFYIANCIILFYVVVITKIDRKTIISLNRLYPLEMLYNMNTYAFYASVFSSIIIWWVIMKCLNVPIVYIYIINSDAVTWCCLHVVPTAYIIKLII